MNFALGSSRFRGEKRPNILGTSSGAKFEKQSKYGEAYDVEYTAGNVTRCHLDRQNSSRRVTGLKCSYGKISSPLTEISVGKTEILGTEPVCHEYIENLTKDLEPSKARSWKPGQPGPEPGTYEEALTREFLWRSKIEKMQWNSSALFDLWSLY